MAAYAWVNGLRICTDDQLALRGLPGRNKSLVTKVIKTVIELYSRKDGNVTCRDIRTLAIGGNT
jgi:hypothetical protein